MEHSIIKLRKGDVVQYPITRPELVMYDFDESKGYAETVYSKISDLEKGRNDYFYAYNTAYNNYIIDKNEPKLFLDKDTYSSYLAAKDDTINKKIKRILIPSVIGDVMSWSHRKYSVSNQNTETSDNFAVWFYYEDIDSESTSLVNNDKLFTMKHFVSLMNGNLPDEILVKDTQHIYNTVVKFDIDTIYPNADVPSIQSNPYKALIIEMADNESDILRIEISPGTKNGCRAIAYSKNDLQYRKENEANG
jgi:hypothetical protein